MTMRECVLIAPRLQRRIMSNLLCNTENYGGGEAHYANRSSFDWVKIEGNAMWVCDDCRVELGDEDE